MRSENEVPFEDKPFRIKVADRVNRLPPYMFGKINKLKYQKRVAGVDVIDLGMGNPTDAPDPLIVDKLSEALADPRNHRYSVSNGIENLRKEVSARYWKRYGVRLAPDSEVIACLGSKEGFSHMCLALMGPGDTAMVPAPSFPIHVYAVMLASGNVIALDVRKPDVFLQNVAYTCEHLYPKPKVVIVNFPHNPSTTVVEPEFFVDLVALAKKYGLLVISDFAYADIGFDGSANCPRATISFNLVPGFALGDAAAGIDGVIRDLRIPPTHGAALPGKVQAFQQSFKGLSILLIVAILVIYMVLGMLYEASFTPSPFFPDCLPPFSARC